MRYFTYPEYLEYSVTNILWFINAIYKTRKKKEYLRKLNKIRII